MDRTQVANFWLSSHNFGEVAVIQIFPKLKRVLYGAAMLDDVPSLRYQNAIPSLSIEPGSIGSHSYIAPENEPWGTIPCIVTAEKENNLWC